MEVFVYGSNEQGIHGAGSALEARLKHGAILGRTERRGSSYGISTKKTPRETLPLKKIQRHVDKFLEHAREHPEDIFRVVPIGCGRAGFKPVEIAPMFRKRPKNVKLPEEFLEVLRVLKKKEL